MIDINATDFVNTFKIEDGTVGIIGHGYVGQALEHFFKQSKVGIRVYDKAKPQLGRLQEVVAHAQVIFVAVPTPMRSDGSCHTGIVESVLCDIRDEAARTGRTQDSFVVVVKSTVPPGFTEEMQERFPNMRLCFSPEFLTEKNSFSDFLTQNRIIIGGDEEDTLVVFKFFEGVMPERVANDRVLLLQCYPTVAEAVKLFANGILATKVMFANEMLLVCERLGIEFEEVRQLAVLDRRIGSGHTSAPGPDGKLGFGGHCFPKDLESLRKIARDLGTGERLFTAVLERNKEVREDRDWEKMEGRAVISDAT